MQTLNQAIQLYRDEQARKAQEEQAAMERANQAVEQKQREAIALLIKTLQPYADFDLNDLIWSASFVAHQSTKHHETYEFSFRVNNGNGVIHIEDQATWNKGDQHFHFYDKHGAANNKREDLSQITWRVIGDAYGFSHSIIEAVCKIAPPPQEVAELPF